MQVSGQEETSQIASRDLLQECGVCLFCKAETTAADIAHGDVPQTATKQKRSIRFGDCRPGHRVKLVKNRARSRWETLSSRSGSIYGERKTAMETSPLDRQLQSAQRNITFLKGEHMDLLHGLHMEILQLQKRCTELTYELALKPPKSDLSDPAEWEVNCEPLEAKISEKELENTALRRELYHKEALISALEDSMRKRERMFLEELKKRSHRATVLSSELQKQSETAASLSFQLRSAKQRLSASRASSQPRDKPPAWDRPPPTSPVYVAVAQKRNCKLHARKSEVGCADRASGKESGRQRRDVCWDELDPMPDPELFLQARWRYGQQQQQQQQTSSHESRLGLAASSYQMPRTVPAFLPATTDSATSPLLETEIPLTDEEADKD